VRSDAGNVAKSVFFGCSQTLSEIYDLRLKAGIAGRRKRDIAGSGATRDGDEIWVRIRIFQLGAIGVWFVCRDGRREEGGESERRLNKWRNERSGSQGQQPKCGYVWGVE
jgi:hypothetical protein